MGWWTDLDTFATKKMVMFPCSKEFWTLKDCDVQATKRGDFTGTLDSPVMLAASLWVFLGGCDVRKTQREGICFLGDPQTVKCICFFVWNRWFECLNISNVLFAWKKYMMVGDCFIHSWSNSTPRPAWRSEAARKGTRTVSATRLLRPWSWPCPGALGRWAEMDGFEVWNHGSLV